jgi:hypothetical protein
MSNSCNNYEYYNSTSLVKLGSTLEANHRVRTVLPFYISLALEFSPVREILVDHRQ